MKMDIIEISHFKLFYDGMYKLKFVYLNEKYEVKVYLPPAMLLKIFQNEVLENIGTLDFCLEGVTFSKTTLLLSAFYGESDDIEMLNSEDDEYADVITTKDYDFRPNYYSGFLTSDAAEHYLDSGFGLTSCEIKDNQ